MGFMVSGPITLWVKLLMVVLMVILPMVLVFILIQGICKQIELINLRLTLTKIMEEQQKVLIVDLYLQFFILSDS